MPPLPPHQHIPAPPVPAPSSGGREHGSDGLWGGDVRVDEKLRFSAVAAPQHATSPFLSPLRLPFFLQRHPTPSSSPTFLSYSPVHPRDGPSQHTRQRAVAAAAPTRAPWRWRRSCGGWWWMAASATSASTSSITFTATSGSLLACHWVRSALIWLLGSTVPLCLHRSDICLDFGSATFRRLVWIRSVSWSMTS